MDDYSFTSYEYELIDKIIYLTKKIYKVYLELYNYEINGQKNDIVYNRKIKYLLALIEKEHYLYSQLNLNEQKCLDLFSYLFDKKFNDINEDDNVLFQEENVNILLRIFYNISPICLMNFSYNVMSDFSLVVSKGTMLDDLQINDVVKSFQKDLYIKAIAIMEEYIESDKYQYIKKLLLKSKYLLAFGNRDIEVEMLENNFRVIQTTGFQSEWLSYLYEIDDIDYYLIRNSFAVIEYSRQLNYLLNFKNNQIKHRSMMAIFIMRQSILRASLLFMSDKKIKEISNNLYDLPQLPSFQTVQCDRKKFNL